MREGHFLAFGKVRQPLLCGSAEKEQNMTSDIPLTRNEEIADTLEAMSAQREQVRFNLPDTELKAPKL